MNLRRRMTLWNCAAVGLVMLLYGAAIYFMASHALAGTGRGHELREILVVLILALPVGAGAGAVIAHLLARRISEPIEYMAKRASEIGADSLGDRLTVPDPYDEMGRLATSFNYLLLRLERSFEQLRRFTADASHELRTPLTALRAVGENALAGSETAPPPRSAIESMLEEVDRLSHLVDSLLSLTRADAGATKIAREAVDLVELAEEVVGLLQPLADERGATIALDAEPRITTIGDRPMLRQALINLIHNAIIHGVEPPSPTNPSSRSTIEVRVEKNHDKSPQVSITDHGPGIAPAHVRQLFDRFFRVDEARSREGGGTGLGLAIAEFAARAHGGGIDVSSEVGGGSRFTLRLRPANETPP